MGGMEKTPPFQYYHDYHFATVLIAVIVLVAGRETSVDGFYLSDAGWYMTMVQPWATMFVLPAIIAMLGSYMICREEQDDTLKSLLLILVSETALTADNDCDLYS